jgi:hypothetical protein
MAVEKNLVWKQGDSLPITIKMKYNSVLTDITGWKFFVAFKRNKSDSDEAAALYKSWTDHTDPTNGESLKVITAAETAVLSGVYFYELQYLKPDDTVKTFLEGTIRFTTEVIKARV